MPTTTKGTGTDLLIHLVGDDAMPKATTMTEKWSIERVKKKFGNHTVVYLWNKNLQNLPHRVRGGLIWLPQANIIGYIMDSIGFRARVCILFPLSKRGDEAPIEDLRTDGCYLQQVQGVQVLPFDQEHRAHKIDPETREVFTFHDTKGCIKVNIQGPDVVCVEARKVSKETRKYLKEGDVTSLNRGKLPLPQAKHQKFSCSGVLKQEKASFAVVYVYALQNTNYTTVEQALDHKGELKGVYSIPIGKKIESTSKR